MKLIAPLHLGLLVILTACSPAPAGTNGAEPAPSFQTAVAPLLVRNCASCHTAGGVGARALIVTDATGQISYELTKGHAASIVREVVSGRMPKGRGPLSADEVAILQKWQAAGAPNN